MAKQTVKEYAETHINKRTGKNYTAKAIYGKIKSGELKSKPCECGQVTYVIVDKKSK